MKKQLTILFLLLLFSSPILLKAQPLYIWEKDFAKEIMLRKVISNEDGIYLIGSKKSSSEISSQDLMIVKMNFKGEVMWEKIYGGSNLELPSRILQTLDGGYLISTLTRSYNGFEKYNIKHIGSGDIILLKFNKDWEVEWAQCLGTSTFDTPKGLVEIPGEGYVVSGWTETRNRTSKNAPDRNIYVAKVNLKGEKIWEKSFGGSERDVNMDVVFVENKIYILSSTYSQEIIDSDRFGIAFWLLCLDIEGEELWSRVFPKSNIEFIAKIINYQNSLWVVKNKYFGVDKKLPPILQSDVQFSKINKKGKIKSEKYLGDDFQSEKIYHAKVINDEIYVLFYSPFGKDRQNVDVDHTVNLVKFEPKKEKRKVLWSNFFYRKKTIH